MERRPPVASNPDGLSERGERSTSGVRCLDISVSFLSRLTLPTLVGPYEMAVKNNPTSMKEPTKDSRVSMKKHRVSVKALPRGGRDRMPRAPHPRYGAAGGVRRDGRSTVVEDGRAGSTGDR